jgi:hypothetical protein
MSAYAAITFVTDRDTDSLPAGDFTPPSSLLAMVALTQAHPRTGRLLSFLRGRSFSLRDGDVYLGGPDQEVIANKALGPFGVRNWHYDAELRTMLDLVASCGIVSTAVNRQEDLQDDRRTGWLSAERRQAAVEETQTVLDQLLETSLVLPPLYYGFHPDVQPLLTNIHEKLPLEVLAAYALQRIQTEDIRLGESTVVGQSDWNHAYKQGRGQVMGMWQALRQDYGVMADVLLEQVVESAALPHGSFVCLPAGLVPEELRAQGCPLLYIGHLRVLVRFNHCKYLTPKLDHWAWTEDAQRCRISVWPLPAADDPNVLVDANYDLTVTELQSRSDVEAESVQAGSA